MNKNATLTKTCSNCGLEKPLSAFLQIAGPEGTMYGNICSDCRKGKIDKKALTSEDEMSRTDSGVKVDNKFKQQSHDEKAKARKEIQEKYKEEREKLKETNTSTIEKIERKEKLEKRHRESFLNTRNLSSTERKESAAKPEQTNTIAAAVGKEEKTRSEQATKEEAQAKGFDSHAPQIPSQTGALQKTQGASFKAWIQLMGPSAAISRAFGVDKQQQNKVLPNQKNEAGKPNEKTVDKDAVKDFIKENFNPSKRSR